MKRFRCYNCNAPFGLEFESDGPKCPSCGLGIPAVVPLVDVHWLRAVEGGPITGWGGRTYAVACKSQRKNVLNIAATGSPDAVTCPACKAMREHAESLAALLEGGE